MTKNVPNGTKRVSKRYETNLKVLWGQSVIFCGALRHYIAVCKPCVAFHGLVWPHVVALLLVVLWLVLLFSRSLIQVHLISSFNAICINLLQIHKFFTVVKWKHIFLRLEINSIRKFWVYSSLLWQAFGMLD